MGFDIARGPGSFIGDHRRGGAPLVIRAPIRMLVSSTTRTCGVHFLVNQVEDVLLVLPGVTVLDPANGEVQHVATHGFIDESGQVAL